MNALIRIRPAALRVALLCLVFPLVWLHTVLTHLLPAAWGGHPNKRRLLCADYWALPFSLFWAACAGSFVK